MKPDISIITISNNMLPLLLKSLHSIFLTSKNINIEIFVVDNASTDYTGEVVSVKYPQIKIIRNKKRKGFASNNNACIKRAKGKYILLLNPDTELLPSALKNIISFMDTYKNVGVCAPQLLNPDRTLQYSCRHFPTWKTFFIRRTPLRYIFPSTAINDFHLMKNENHNKTQKVDWVLGGCMCIRKKMIDLVGYLDERFYLYVEDIDYCLRVWHAGWKVCYVPTARVIHHHQARSDKKLFSIYSWHHMQSVIRFTLKHGMFLKRVMCN
ncbi:MAG: glycosyltransferase family 2 protein [Candidatus Gottesmanbacteria bacterium]